LAAADARPASIIGYGESSPKLERRGERRTVVGYAGTVVRKKRGMIAAARGAQGGRPGPYSTRVKRVLVQRSFSTCHGGRARPAAVAAVAHPVAM